MKVHFERQRNKGRDEMERGTKKENTTENGETRENRFREREEQPPPINRMKKAIEPHTENRCLETWHHGTSVAECYDVTGVAHQ